MFRKYFLSNRIYYIILNLFLLIIFITALKSCTKQVTTVKSSDEIRSAIIKRVVNNEHLPYSDIRISIQDRIVILQGEAPTLYIKEKAAQVIKTIKEVRTVINRLKLKEYHVNDARLQNQVYDSLKTNMLTKNSQIESSIRLGVATLKGVVHLNAVKKCASSIVKKIHGIKGVYNDLYISPRFNITGVKIKETLLFSLKNNPFVYNRFIDVKISNGVVTFSGMVGSMAEKQEVRYIAQKIGVKKIINNIAIKSYLYDPWKRSRAEVYNRTDRQLKNSLVDAILLDNRINEKISNINIQVTQGRVTLTGVVDSEKAKKAVYNNAINTTGVIQVNETLNVKRL